MTFSKYIKFCNFVCHLIKLSIFISSELHFYKKKTLIWYNLSLPSPVVIVIYKIEAKFWLYGNVQNSEHRGGSLVNIQPTVNNNNKIELNISFSMFDVCLVLSPRTIYSPLPQD